MPWKNKSTFTWQIFIFESSASFHWVVVKGRGYSQSLLPVSSLQLTYSNHILAPGFIHRCCRALPPDCRSLASNEAGDTACVAGGAWQGCPWRSHYCVSCPGSLTVCLPWSLPVSVAGLDWIYWSWGLRGLLWHSCKLGSTFQGRSVWILFLQVYSLLGLFQMFMELLFPAPVPQISKAIYMVLLPKLLTGISKLESWVNSKSQQLLPCSTQGGCLTIESACV